MYKKIASLNDLSEGKVLSVETRFIRVSLVLSGNEVLAFEDMCSHDGEPISEGKLEGSCITCPRHLAKFDLKTGKALCMPATEPIQVFPVRIIGFDIEVDLEDF
jgi:3-phenylpropionate/trans-cinnamate dioxygenase ferredoxin subunit